MQRTITIYPSDRIPSLLANAGRQPADGVPFRWLEALVQSIRSAIDDAEEPTCMLYGTEHLRAEFLHTLSPLEVAQAESAALRDSIARALAVLDDNTLDALQRDEALRKALGRKP